MIKSIESNFFSFDGQWALIAVKWAPKAIIAGGVGYYSLGVAYDTGFMAKIDYYAIKVFRNSLGYTGLGAIMPTFQWYSAWTVRIGSAIVAAGIYDLTLKVAGRFAQTINSYRKQENAATQPLQQENRV